MDSLKINIVLPFPVTKPGGGAKIMYEYANRLYKKGHRITIYHSIKRPFKKSKTPVWIKQVIFFFRGVARPDWFPLHKNIESKIVPEITDKYLHDADIIFSTWWQMAYAINSLSTSKGKKFNLIQGYEKWDGQHTAVDDSFKLPIKHLVISGYLQKLVEDISGTKPPHLPNAIDTTIFTQKNNAAARDPFTVIMLYSREHYKGSDAGLEALRVVHKKYNQLKVILFGVGSSPADLPAWISYYQKPKNLADLYNAAAVFFSPSLTEGWALPPAEAMACSCSVVCTDIGGHTDYAIHEETALLVQPNNTTDMAEKIIRIIEDTEMRNKIVANGMHMINTFFSWTTSVNSLEAVFYESLKK